MGLVSRLIVPGLFSAEVDDRGQAVPFHPEEEVLVAKAGAKRRRDFALGRFCAHAALARMGESDAVIGMAENGAPLWPKGIVGSITHTGLYAAALAGEARQFSGIGLDAERIGGVTRDLWPRLFDAAEQDYLRTLDADSAPRAATVLFSAKETCFKAWGGQGPLSFRDIRIAVPDEENFTANRAGRSLEGWYAVEGDLALTAAWF